MVGYFKIKIKNIEFLYWKSI